MPGDDGGVVLLHDCVRATIGPLSGKYVDLQRENQSNGQKYDINLRWFTLPSLGVNEGNVEWSFAELLF